MIDVEQLAGSRIDDRFELQAVIGRGASGIVYRASNATGQLLALKLVVPVLGNERTSARYLRGTRLASRLQHPHIVRVLDSGRWGPQRRCYYLAMELVVGVSLRLLRNGGLRPGQAVGLVNQILEAAIYVHARGTLHRDLKPDNVMVSRRPAGDLSCQVTDFGIASNQMQDASLTLQGAVVGTPTYMAPEQAQGLPSMGPEIDIYAIGVILYELLCGRLPFAGPVQSLLYRKVHGDPPRLPNETALPAGLPEVVMRMIARRPEARFSHALDALTALQPFARPPIVDDETWMKMETADSETTRGNIAANALSAETVSAASRPNSRASNAASEQLWGRDEILEQLDLHARTVEEGVPRMVLLSGGLGVGKSALMDELAIRLQEKGRFQVLRTAFSTASHVEGGLRGAVELSLGVRGRSAATVLVAVQEHMRQIDEDDPDEVQTLVDWLRPPLTATTPAAPAANADNSPGLRYLRRLARSRPVLLVIDDLHLGVGDAAVLIEFLVFEMGFEPCDLLVVGAMVSGELSADFQDGLIRSSHAEGQSRHIVHVPALPHQVIVRGLRQELSLSTARAKAIADRAGGNPLIARGLAQAAETDSLHTNTLDNPEILQGTLRSMLQRTLQGLYSVVDTSDALRRMLQALAILGTRVEVGTLAKFLDMPVEDPNFEPILDLLIERNVVTELRGDGRDRVELQPSILGQVVLTDLGRRQRRRMHQRAIQILEASGDVDPGVLGDHHIALDEPTAAIDCWKRAHTRALSAGAPFAAVEWGLKLMPLLSESKRAFWGVRLGRILLDAGDPRRAEQLLCPVVDAAPADLALVAGDVLCDVYENLGEGAKWTALARRIESLHSRAPRTGRHAALCALAMWRTSHGDDNAGREAAEQAVDISETPAEIRRAAQRLAFSCLPSLSLERAGEAAEQALEASGTHPQLRARSLRTLGVVRMWQGRGDDAVALHEEALALARWKGLSSRAALALQDLGDALRVSGQYLAAQQRYLSSIQAAEALDLRSTVYLDRFKLLMCDIALDQSQDIEQKLKALSGPADEAGLALAIPFANLLLAWSCARANRIEDAKVALASAQVLEDFQVDPQVPAIFEEVRAVLLK